MNKSRSSSSLLSIHEGIPPKVIQKQYSSSLIEEWNDSSSELNDDSSVNESDFDDSTSNSNNYSSSNNSSLEYIDFVVHSYQFEINSKHKNKMHEYSSDPMIHHILNDNDMYTHDPDITINNEYYSKEYNDSEIMKINLFKDYIQSFISDFNIEEYEMNKDKNDAINISKFKKYLSNEEE